ncbi:MAG: hypothetical protein B7Y56_06780 [Gallionellales bacterium 35-53-114]|jgi:hypothetical protein|nr:MAG: hypothetical protein B7Y56_06780 [Gallionellales bacterium 35-53-114]OYZ63894.1 MAG: hypothetical protein B7Y04_07875 [Gallionellales bacterium 24-53-125]OZB09275.1 MAG: hypothetical protein B7X61_06335 [Gallionellales bacterium 39-52-133]HQS59116.1 hypothetical protein [Gallionellaceae bacterium]HQS75852.1 hypothetical protein [Gallionellaceae bacterium]
MQLQTKQLGILAALALLMAATRYNHFGSSISLPDASLAVFLLAGLLMARSTWPALLVFVFLLLEAGGIDYYAINVAGVSDWCVTPAYWFLIPTYAVMWLGGRWFAARQQNSWTSLALFGALSWLATSAAFVISNTSFFLLSGRYAEMSVAEYAGRVAQYYPPYLSGSLMYLALASVIYIMWNEMYKKTPGVANN